MVCEESGENGRREPAPGAIVPAETQLPVGPVVPEYQESDVKVTTPIRFSTSASDGVKAVLSESATTVPSKSHNSIDGFSPVALAESAHTALTIAADP